jgi:hypothetical protein
MFNIIQQNDDYVLILEKMQGNLWLELIEKKTGLAQTLIHTRGFGHTKKSITDSYSKIDMKKIVDSFNKFKIEKFKVYKENFMIDNICESV